MRGFLLKLWLFLFSAGLFFCFVTGDDNHEETSVIEFNFLKSELDRSLVSISEDELVLRRIQLAQDNVPGYNTASRLAQYAADGRGTFWMSNEDSTFFDTIFGPFKWLHIRLPWEAKIVYLTRKRHVELLELYHEEDEDVREFPYLLNRIEASSCLTDKAQLQHTLRDYVIPNRGPATLFQTPTHVLHSGKACRALLETLGSDNGGRIWVHKLASESQGKGIALIPPNSNTTLCNTTDEEYKDQVVLQAHIDYPFTLRNKKSEIRAYWFIASVDPLIVLLYHRGQIRLATHDYVFSPDGKSHDLENPLIHILNTRQQKDANPHDNVTAQDRKCSWHEIPRALREANRIPHDLSDDQWIASILLPKIHEIVYHLARAAQPTLQDKENNPLGKENRRFELFGLDIIFEDVVQRNAAGSVNNLGEGGMILEPGGLKAWVTEAQVGPGLSVDSKTKMEVRLRSFVAFFRDMCTSNDKAIISNLTRHSFSVLLVKLIPPLLVEMVNIMLEIDERRMNGESLNTIESLENFQVVVNDADASPLSWDSNHDPKKSPSDNEKVLKSEDPHVEL